MTAVTAPSLNQFQAAGARLKPIRATIHPVTVGGMMRSIQTMPAKCTITPISAKVTPTLMAPPSAADCPYWEDTAVIGAINAKDDPK